MLPGLGEAAELRNERGSAHRMQIEAKATAFYLLIWSHVWLFSLSLCKFIYIYVLYSIYLKVGDKVP